MHKRNNLIMNVKRKLKFILYNKQIGTRKLNIPYMHLTIVCIHI